MTVQERLKRANLMILAVPAAIAGALPVLGPDAVGLEVLERSSEQQQATK